MPKQLTDVAIASFDARVKHHYADMASQTTVLRSTIQMATGVVGSTHRFQTQGKGTATRRVPQTDVVPMNITYGSTTATLEDWNAPEYTDIFDQQEVNFAARENLSMTLAGAMNRREDQLVIDALYAAATANTIAHGSTGMTTAKATAARTKMSKLGIPKMDRYALVGVDTLGSLLGDADVKTIDSNTIKALVQGELNKWLGFMWMEMEDRDEGGITAAANVETNLFYHKSAAGLAIGIDQRASVDWIAEKTSWLANRIFKAGSVYIDATGIVEVAAQVA